MGAPVNDDKIQDIKYAGLGAIFLYIKSEKLIKESILRKLAVQIEGDFKDISINYIFKKGQHFSKKAVLLEADRSQRRTMTHYLKPIYAGINLVAKQLNEKLKQNVGNKNSIQLATILELQGGILNHIGEIMQLSPGEINYEYNEFAKVKLTTFLKYLYIRAVFIGDFIDFSIIQNYTEEDIQIIKECATALPVFKGNDFDRPASANISSLFDKVLSLSQFKLCFISDTDNLFIKLPKKNADKNLLASIIIQFSSAIIDNYKKHWIKSSLILSTKIPAVYKLSVFTKKIDDDRIELYFFQNKNTNGYDRNIVDETNEIYAAPIKNGFILKDIKIEEDRIGLADIRKLFQKADLKYEIYTKEFPITSEQINAVTNTVKIIIEKEPGRLFFQKISFTNSNKFISYEKT